MPPQGLVTDRVARNVEEARNALRLLFQSTTNEQIAGTAYGLVQAAGEYLDHVRTARVLGDPAQPDPDPPGAAQAPGALPGPRDHHSMTGQVNQGKWLTLCR